MDDPNITMEEYIRLEEEKARRRGKVYNWETATYGKIWDNEDVHDLGSVETEFPSIVFNDTLTSEAALSCEPTVSSLNNEIDFRISFDESDDEDYTISFRCYMSKIGVLHTSTTTSSCQDHALEDSQIRGGRARDMLGIDRAVRGPREGNIDEYWWRIYESGNLEVLES
ncbi:hypothetical protein Tco_1494361 [Tanacetum coccineum]